MYFKLLSFGVNKLIYIVLQTIASLHQLSKQILTTETNDPINWFSENRITVNPDKSKNIVVKKNEVFNQTTHFMIKNKLVGIEFFYEAVRNQYL